MVMELRGEDEEIGTPPSPSTLCFNPSIRESSIKLSNSPLSAAAESLHFAHRQNLNSQKLSLRQHLDNHTREHSDPISDPVPTSVAVAASLYPPTTNPPLGNSRSVSRTPLTTAGDNPSSSSIRYKECLKNHAARTGRHVLDGCGEFMPSGEDGTLEALKCAACECHRNFHRKETKDEPLQPLALPSGFFISNPIRNRNSHRTDRTAPTLPHHRQLPALPISSMMAFGGSNGAPAESSSEDLNLYHHSNNGTQDLFKQQQMQIAKKRFRTKFTQGQKDKMVEFAEKLGWRIQKHDELEVQQFCNEVGVKRQVFKVWMHNNKQAMKRKQM